MDEEILNPAASPPLVTLRAEIDGIDDALHDLLMRRAEVVERVRREGGKTGAKIRPGREAAMLRRLLARHAGGLPPQTVLRFWREMFAGALMIEGGQTVVVCDGDDGSDRNGADRGGADPGGADRVALAREHFGPLTPLRRCHNPARTLAELAREAAHVAVLPPLGDGDDAGGAWWASLATAGAHRFSVIGKLPFWTRRAEGAPAGDAIVVAAMRPDPSGLDRGLILLELEAELSRARLTGMLAAAGFTAGAMWMRRSAAEGQVKTLVEVEGLVADDDARLALIAGPRAPACVLGGYAVPIGAEG